MATGLEVPAAIGTCATLWSSVSSCMGYLASMCGGNQQQITNSVYNIGIGICSHLNCCSNCMCGNTIQTTGDVTMGEALAPGAPAPIRRATSPSTQITVIADQPDGQDSTPEKTKRVAQEVLISEI